MPPSSPLYSKLEHPPLDALLELGAAGVKGGADLREDGTRERERVGDVGVDVGDPFHRGGFHLRLVGPDDGTAVLAPFNVAASPRRRSRRPVVVRLHVVVQYLVDEEDRQSRPGNRQTRGG